MSHRLRSILILAGVASALALVAVQRFRGGPTRSYAPDATFVERARLADFAAYGVRVVLFLDADSRGQPLLRGTFTPTNQEFHIYSKDLDPKTVGGVGMPTRLELLPNSSVKPAGELFADVAPLKHQVKALGLTLDIYPEGPVNLRLPIQFVGVATNIPAQVAVSYMACNTTGACLRAVKRQVLDVQIVPR